MPNYNQGTAHGGERRSRADGRRRQIQQNRKIDKRVKGRFSGRSNVSEIKEISQMRGCNASEAYWGCGDGNDCPGIWFGTPICIQWTNNNNGTHTMSMVNTVQVGGFQVTLNENFSNIENLVGGYLGPLTDNGYTILHNPDLGGGGTIPAGTRDMYIITTGNTNNICVTPILGLVTSDPEGFNLPTQAVNNPCDDETTCTCGLYEWYVDDYACNWDSNGLCYDESACQYPTDLGYGECDDCQGVCRNTGECVDDECGVCAGSGVDDNDCCPINNNGYPDGFGPWGQNPDCFGVCGGGAREDECGVCDGPGIDCDGTCNWSPGTEDCAGVCNGSAVTDIDGACCDDSVLDACGICNGGEIDGNSCGLPFYFVGYAYHDGWGETVQCYCDSEWDAGQNPSDNCDYNYDSPAIWPVGCGGDAEDHPQYGDGGVNCTDFQRTPGYESSYNSQNKYWNYGQYCPDARDHGGHPDPMYQDYCPYGYGCGERQCGLLWKCCSNSCGNSSPGMNYTDNDCPIYGWDEPCNGGWCPCTNLDDKFYCRPGWYFPNAYPQNNFDNPCRKGTAFAEEGKHFDKVCQFTTDCDVYCYENDGTLKDVCNPLTWDRDGGSDISPIPPKEGNIGQR